MSGMSNPIDTQFHLFKQLQMLRSNKADCAGIAERTSHIMEATVLLRRGECGSGVDLKDIDIFRR
jgi:hypothetical protein